MTKSNDRYLPAYGQWAGNPKGNAPDFDRCCEEVWPPNWAERHHQCRKPRGHGPGEAYCKTHNPEAVQARRDAQRAEYNRKWNQRRYEIHGKTFYNALKAIADGHNDARGLAAEVIAKFHEGDK